eukprot:CAMPEP_0194486222 /NCGR_PEP_ID=MMETSP0253-20130528/6958_1 /TAXON_ID=2966 /ORGANISM="Noctiluca scintillans" /LENGTH=284 /DNA_ID=CAMNT_0039326293 /DNA_START=73 /DNA_END=927 /DNA_ORIENTATION=+
MVHVQVLEGSDTRQPHPNLFEYLPESSDIRQPYPAYFEYLPDANVALCACLKCGSTSFYALAYKTLFGKEWPYQGLPWVQEVYSDRWEGKVTTISVDEMKKKKVTSIALLRDPKERLISAWKSKVACDEDAWNTDKFERQNVVDNLLLLANRSQGENCMHMEQFLGVLHDIHEAGNDWMLNWHFLPQQFGCLYHLAPHEWTVASTINDPNLASSLSVALGGPADVSMPYEHSTGHRTVDVSEKAQRLLDYVTRKEYAVLGHHLASSESHKTEPPPVTGHPFWVP